jgi:hypothetical protein
MCQTWPKVLTQNTQLNTYIWLGYRDDYIFEVQVKILFYFLFVKTYFTHSLQKFTLLKIDCKKYLYLKKNIVNLLLRCEIWKLMHNNEEPYCIWSFM